MVRVTKVELHRTIREIMMKGNLDQLTTKKIRMLCEQKYKMDLTSRKQEIDNIVVAFIKRHDKTGSFEGLASDASDDSSDESGSSGSESTSGSESESESESEDEKTKNKPGANIPQPSPNISQPSPKRVPTKSDEPPKKIQAIMKPEAPKKVAPTKPVAPAKKNIPAKKSSNIRGSNKAASGGKNKAATAVKQSEVDDAEFARQLQAQEWNLRQRTGKKSFRSAPYKKSDKSDAVKKERAKPFMKKCLLSPALAEVLGSNEMSRPDVVQKMWSIVRERNLFDTSNKQYALCDEQLAKLFGKKRVRLIGMMKYLKSHIKDIQ